MMPPTIAERLKSRNPVAKPKPAGPLWMGPEAEGPMGGITQSMIRSWLTCRERARVKYVEGLSPAEGFNHRIEYGNMWHVCEEELAKNPKDWSTGWKGETIWDSKLKDYAQSLIEKYPLAQEEIEKWYNVCKVQFPVYVEYWRKSKDVKNRAPLLYWRKSKDVKNRAPLLSEQVFDVPYRLPSGRTVRLRGKWDSVDVVTEKGNPSVWLQENKTKGDIDVLAIQRQLTFDLQSNLYLVALSSWCDLHGHPKPVGVRYNVVRRPLSGGEGMITRKKGSKNVRPETAAEYYDRLRGVIDGTGLKTNGERYEGPSYWFMRWTAEVSAADLKRFRERCLDPILEQICCWYTNVTGTPTACPDWSQNYLHPFGASSSLDDYEDPYGAYLATGSKVGLDRSTLFRELQ